MYLSNISFTWARLKFDFKPVMLNLDFLALVNNDYIYNNNNCINNNIFKYFRKTFLSRFQKRLLSLHSSILILISTSKK